MTTLDRTHLQKPLKAQLAAFAFTAQMFKASFSQLARAFEVSRPTVYTAAKTAKRVLERHFEDSQAQLGRRLTVDEAHLRRCVIALRTIAPISLRAIEALIPILFPGRHLAYGKIHTILSEAERKAAQLNATTDLSAVEAVALDELFSQGRPVLAGIDLDSGFLLALQDRDTRTQEDWQQVLQAAKHQGLRPKRVVKDAAAAIEAAVGTVLKDAEIRFDSFHAKYELMKTHTVLERRAYQQIEKEIALERRCLKAVQKGHSHPRVAGGQLARQRKKTRAAIERYDAYRVQMQKIFDLLWYVDAKTGQLRTKVGMHYGLVVAVQRLKAIPGGRIRKVAGYIERRIAGLCSAMEGLRRDLRALERRFGPELLGFGCLFYRLVISHRRNRNTYRRAQLHAQLCDVFEGLWQVLGDDVVELLNGVHEVLARHHVASSQIEGFNGQLRPHLYVHKRVTSGFLALFRFGFNFRRRGLGKAKQPSPYERLTGQACEDWLSHLGYPPSTAIAH